MEAKPITEVAGQYGDVIRVGLLPDDARPYCVELTIKEPDSRVVSWLTINDARALAKSILDALAEVPSETSP